MARGYSASQSEYSKREAEIKAANARDDARATVTERASRKEYKGYANPGVTGFNKFIDLIQSNDKEVQRADRNDAVQALRREIRDRNDVLKRQGRPELNLSQYTATELMQDWLKQNGWL